MSTKTTFKRIALVAVAALGLGVLSSVAPASAATTKTVQNVIDISLTTDKAPVAGSLGTSSVHTVTFFTDSTGATTVNAIPVLVTKPALSQMAVENMDNSLSGTGKWQMSSAAFTAHDALARTTTGGTAYNTLGADISASTGSANKYHVFNIHAWYDVPGTYVWSIRDESTDGSTSVGGIDYAENFTVVVGGASNGVAATGALSAVNATSATQATTSGSLVKVTLTDAAGVGIAPDATAGVTVTLSGAAKVYAVNDVALTTAATSYTLSAGEFSSTGVAYVNVTNATAEAVTMSLSNAGFGSFTAPSPVTLTFKSAAGTSTTAAPAATGSALFGTGTPYNYDATAGTKTNKWTLGTAQATDVLDMVLITDTTGKITGLAGADYAITVGAAVAATTAGSFSISTTATSGSYTIKVNAGSNVVATAAARSVATISVENGDARKSVTGGTNSFIVLVKNNFGAVVGAQTVTATIAGRNSTVVVASAATDADGYATLSFKDASTSTTALSDVITFTAGSVTDTASITYVTTLGVATVLLTTPNTDALGVTEAVATATDIQAGDGAETATGATVTATVTDAAKTALSGVPVVFTVTGTGAAVISTQVTGYTNVLGKASATVYGWITGTYTVTATAGGVSDTAPVNFNQTGEARNIKATVVGNVVTALVTDRFGNPVVAAPVYASRVGSGSFNGVSTANGTTGKDGKIDFILSGGTGTVTVRVSDTDAKYAQTDALAGLIDGTTATNVFTAYTAGTTVVAEEGVGASFSPAGNNSASAEVASDPTADASQAAADAAAEATDAANAATDAANAAAEAADAATAAAQDAADAVAALSTQVSEMVNALKKQITALTNLVIKIQKKVRA
jgi:trimeric autotransporter adhesin